MACIIKQIPEDFVVREKSSLSTDGGPFSYYILKKRGYTTQKAVEKISRVLRKRIKYINYAGNKDKYAVTEQFISILHGPAKSIKMKDIELEFIGRGRERINLGDLEGNEFEITVRGIETPPALPPCVPNYYDTQRFGNTLRNHIIGKMIIKGQYREACEALPELKQKLGNSRDFVGALRSLPKRVLRIYPHAYQSYLWNRIACRYIKHFPHREIVFPLGNLAVPTEKLDNINIPIPGYEMEVPKSSRVASIISDVLKEECIKPEDFRQNHFPEFDLTGGERTLLCDIRDFSVGELMPDELNPGKKKCTIKFFLGPGSYATMVLRVIFGAIKQSPQNRNA